MPEDHRRAPRAAIWTNGDSSPAELLRVVLTWSAERIGAVLGGCTLLSSRRQPAHDAIGGSRPDAAQLAPTAERLHRAIVADPALLAITKRAEESGASVMPLRAGGDACRLDALLQDELEALGLAQPQLTVVSANGRSAAVLWLCRAQSHPVEEGQSEVALRSVLRLLEICVTGLLDDSGREGSPTVPELAELTPREQSVARLVIAGEGNDAIAARLGIAESTVKKHVNRILKKYGVRTRSQLIVLIQARIAGIAAAEPVSGPESASQDPPV